MPNDRLKYVHHFDIGQALYYYCVEHHEGQGSKLYAIQCQLDYKPSRAEKFSPYNFPDAYEVYQELVYKQLDASEVFEYLSKKD